MTLEAGAGYCGGELFFEGFDPTDTADPAPPLILVPPNELQAIARRPVPAGLARSVDYFLVAATAKAVDDEAWPAQGFKHLSHASPSIGHHTMVENHIHPPPLETLVDRLIGVIEQGTIIVFNSATEMPRDPGPRINFFIGGNILGRGLTIDDLIVTYYVREATVSQMDTVWQHARMYGYREDLMPYTRLFVPRRVAANFRGIHESENSLRELLRRDPYGARPIVLVPRGTRATRPNAVDSSYLRVIAAGTAQIIPRRIFLSVDDARPVLDLLQRMNVPIIESDREGRITEVAFTDVIELVNAVPLVEDDPGPWNPDAVVEILNNYQQQQGNFGSVYVRKLDGDPNRSRARLSGNEVDLIRRSGGNRPVLALLYVGEADRPEGWYPTLVMPPDSPNFIISPADD